MLDVPCGDFFWMKSVDMGDVSYTGADIVEKLIAENSARYGGEKVKFRHLNLLQDNLPKVDLVFCRDCLVHFSKGDVRKALENICKSQSQYLLTTTFTDRTSNADIVTGEWRPLNLEVEPFNLAKPIEVINEDCTQADGIYQDKALGLWRVEDIRRSLG